MVKKNGMANVDEHKLKTASINTLRDYIECLPREAFLNWNNEDFDSFKCPSEIPEYIMLGDVCFDLSDFSRDDIRAIQELELFSNNTNDNKLDIASIPFVQRLSDGISLLMRYLPGDRLYVQELMQPILLKLFMSFPACKLDVTMVDPLELGFNFLNILKLAEYPNFARFSGTKIWSKEKDIENAIAILRHRLEKMDDTYGRNQISHLKNEVVRVLAITDFPVCFTDNALRDLYAIVNNRASLGVCVLICANDEELENLKQRNGTLVAEIVRSLVETKASGKRLMFAGSDKDGMFLDLTKIQKAYTFRDTIIDKIIIEMSNTLRIEYRDPGLLQIIDKYESNNWFTGNHDEITIPMGTKGAHTVVNLVLSEERDSTVLMAGHAIGITVLLNTLYTGILINYPPEEVQTYIISLKDNFFSKPFCNYRLPGIRVIANNCEHELVLNVLREVHWEYTERRSIMKQYGVRDIKEYSRLLDVPKAPKLLLILNDVQELFRNEDDSIRDECLWYINELVSGHCHAVGIHLIIACPSFNECPGMEKLIRSAGIRIAVNGSEDGAASILNADNAGIRVLQQQPAGAAIYNDGGGVESANNFFQVSYINENERLDLLARLDAYFTGPDVAPLYEDQQTRVLLTNVEDNIHSCFNKLFLEGSDSVEPLGTSEDGYGLLLGQGYGKEGIFTSELRIKDRDNLLVVSKDERMALSLFELSTLSVLYEELHMNTNEGKVRIYIVDFSAEELSEGECDFEFLESQFVQKVKVVKFDEAEELIASLYKIVTGRFEGYLPASDRIILMFFGINRARRMRYKADYDETHDEEMNPIEMLKIIIAKGPTQGVNNIVWGENIQSIEKILGGHFDALFDKRIAYGLDGVSMNTLVAESEMIEFFGKTAVYMDIAKGDNNTHFRPYDVPAKGWVERYARTYNEAISRGRQ
jgi:hypothetical protein